MKPEVRRFLLLAALCAGGVALLALLFYGSDGFNSLDHRLTGRLVAPSGSLRESLFHGLADLAEPWPLAVALLAVATVAAVCGRYRELALAGVVVLAANLSTQIMKAALAHPRLQSAFGASAPVAVGYPSGHTTAAVAAGFALWLVSPPRHRRLAAGVGLAYGLAVGAGVIVAGWHFVSDVAGAVLVVGFWGCLALAWSTRLPGGNSRESHRREPPDPGLRDLEET